LGRDGVPGRDGLSIVGPAGRDGLNGKDGQNYIECAKCLYSPYKLLIVL